MAADETTKELIRTSLRYDPETGELFWRYRHEDTFSATTKRSKSHLAAVWNAKHAGKPAFATMGSHGYLRGKVGHHYDFAHRIAFFLQTNRFPKECIDHRNGDRLDNRWCNLREATRSQNQMNKKGYGSVPQYIGVSWDKEKKRYVSYISFNGKRTYIGRSKNPELLARKRDQKAKELFGDYARLNFNE